MTSEKGNLKKLFITEERSFTEQVWTGMGYFFRWSDVEENKKTSGD